MTEAEFEQKILIIMSKLTQEEGLMFIDMAAGNGFLNIVNPMIAAAAGFAAGVVVAAWW